MGPDAMILIFLMLSFKPAFSPSSRGSLVLHFQRLKWYSICIFGVVYFLGNLDSSFWFIQPTISLDEGFILIGIALSLKFALVVISFTFWLYWVFVATCQFSLVLVSRDYSSWIAQAPHYGGFPCCRTQVLGTWTSGGATHWLRSCGVQSVWHMDFSGCVEQALVALKYGIIPHQVLKSYPLHWQADTYPLYHQGCPCFGYYWHLNDVKSSNTWIRDAFSFIFVLFNLFQKHFVVFSVQIFNVFGWVSSQVFCSFWCFDSGIIMMFHFQILLFLVCRNATDLCVGFIFCYFAEVIYSF